LTDGSNDKIQVVIDSGVVPKVVHLLDTTEIAVLIPVIRVVGNIVTGSDIQTEKIIAAGALRYFCGLLLCKKINIVKEIAWTISNITAGNCEQIQAVIDAGLIQPLIQIIRTVCQIQYINNKCFKFIFLLFNICIN
jgi:hypothetical protein